MLKANLDPEQTTQMNMHTHSHRQGGELKYAKKCPKSDKSWRLGLHFCPHEQYVNYTGNLQKLFQQGSAVHCKK